MSNLRNHNFNIIARWRINYFCWGYPPPRFWTWPQKMFALIPSLTVQHCLYQYDLSLQFFCNHLCNKYNEEPWTTVSRIPNSSARTQHTFFLIWRIYYAFWIILLADVYFFPFFLLFLVFNLLRSRTPPPDLNGSKPFFTFFFVSYWSEMDKKLIQKFQSNLHLRV